MYLIYCISRTPRPTSTQKDGLSEEGNRKDKMVVQKRQFLAAIYKTYQKDIFTHTTLKLSEIPQDVIFLAGDLQFLASEDDRKHVSDHTMKLLTGERIKEGEKRNFGSPLFLKLLSSKSTKIQRASPFKNNNNIVMHLISMIQKYSEMAKWRLEESHAA